MDDFAAHPVVSADSQYRRPDRDGKMPRYQWSDLNTQQVGTYSEYFVKMELTMYGFQVYGSEVDDRGIDFVARYERGPFLAIQVKSLRSTGYVFMRKEHFQPADNLYLALALLFEGQAPQLFLIPSTVWKSPDAVFVDRNYEGRKSDPEWGLNLSQKNMAALEPYRFERMVERLVGQTDEPGAILPPPANLPARSELPEYLELFGDAGDIAVQVKLTNHDGRVADRRADSRDLGRLLSAENGRPIVRMTFDEWPGELESYKVDLLGRTLTLLVRGR